MTPVRITARGFQPVTVCPEQATADVEAGFPAHGG